MGIKTVSTNRSSQHHLSVGVLRATPLGKYENEQLESAVELVQRELAAAIEKEDELSMKRLTLDAEELRAEVERRNLSAA